MKVLEPSLRLAMRVVSPVPVESGFEPGNVLPLVVFEKSLMVKVRICNLGWRLFPLKVASYTPFFSSLWTSISEMFAKSVHRQLR